jgi:hypothetical protein
MWQHWPEDLLQLALFVFVFVGHFVSVVQGCQIFLGTAYQNGKNIPNDL